MIVFRSYSHARTCTYTQHTTHAHTHTHIHTHVQTHTHTHTHTHTPIRMDIVNDVFVQNKFRSLL